MNVLTSVAGSTLVSPCGGAATALAANRTKAINVLRCMLDLRRSIAERTEQWLKVFRIRLPRRFARRADAAADLRCARGGHSPFGIDRQHRRCERHAQKIADA